MNRHKLEILQNPNVTPRGKHSGSSNYRLLMSLDIIYQFWGLQNGSKSLWGASVINLFKNGDSYHLEIKT